MDKNKILILNPGCNEKTVLFLNSQTKIFSLMCQDSESAKQEAIKPSSHEPLTSFSATTSNSSNISA